MKEEKIIDINGNKYSASTGMPIKKSKIVQKPVKTNKIRSVQSIAQKSQGIYNRTAGKAIHGIGSPIRKIGNNMDIARSKSISHFTPKPIVKPIDSTNSTVHKRKSMDLAPIRHHLTKKIQSHPNVAEVKSSKVIKEEAISEALSKVAKKPKNVKNKKLFKFANIFTVSFLLVAVIIYVTYMSMPIISVKIASAQAGIKATYPEYHPDGYSHDGPVTYSDGEVIINFHANTGKTEFSIRQAKSSWDSSAVKEKINKDLNGEFITTEEKGLTIYTYNGNATWVNGGILYNITGNAPLKSDQIRRIATSL